MEIIDSSCHFLPPGYYKQAEKYGLKIPYMLSRAYSIPTMSDPARRNAQIASFESMRQIPSLVSPYPDDYAPQEQAAALSRFVNEEFARLVTDNPALYAGFVATVPWLYSDDACRELEYAVKTLKAPGVQIGTPIRGMSISATQFQEIFDTAAKLGVAVWLHPTMNMFRHDYETEEASYYEIWWSLGVPYESSAAMVRLAYSGLFERNPKLVVLTHHAGGVIPYLEGRFKIGTRNIGSRTPEEYQYLVKHSLSRPIADVLAGYYADTATLGSGRAIEHAMEFFSPSHVLFGTDTPFGAREGSAYIEQAIETVSRLNCSEREKYDIFCGNAKRLFGVVAQQN